MAWDGFAWSATIFLVWTFIRRWKKREGPTWKHQNKVEIALLVDYRWLLRGRAINPMTAIAVLFLCAGLLVLLLALKRPIADACMGVWHCDGQPGIDHGVYVSHGNDSSMGRNRWDAMLRSPAEWIYGTVCARLPGKVQFLE